MNTNSDRYVIDTYAWVEYLIGSGTGVTARWYIESGSAITPSVVAAELRKWYLKEIEAGRRLEQEMSKHFTYVESRTQVVPLDYSLSLRAGEIDFAMKKRKKDWPLADSIVLATARACLARVISGDPHFRNLEDAIFIGKV